MKKILALFITLSLALPYASLAAVVQNEYARQETPTAPGGGPLFDSSLGYGAFNSPEEIASGRSDAEVAQQMAADQLKNCSQGQTGGSLSQSLLSGLFDGISGALAGGGSQGSGGSNGQCQGGSTQTYKNGDIYVDPMGLKWCYQVCPPGVICEINDGWNICINQGVTPNVISKSTQGNQNCTNNTSGGNSGGGGGGIGDLLGGLGGGDIGGILQQLGKSGLGQELLSSLGIDGKIGNVLQQVLGGDISGALSGLLGGSGGLGGLLSGTGLDSILGGGGLSGLLGGAGGLLGGAGGLLGGVAGLAGGANVPVIDQKLIEQAIKQLLEQMGIHKDSSTLVHKECDIDPLLRQFSNQIGAQTDAAALEDIATGNGGEPRYSTSQNDYSRRHEATVQAYVNGPQVKAICQPFQEQIKNILVVEDQFWTTAAGAQKQLQCNSDDPEAFTNGEYPTNDPIGDILHANVISPQDTYSHALVFAMSQLGAYDAAQQKELDDTLDRGEGFYPSSFTCEDGTKAQSYQDCVNPVIGTPAAVTKESAVFVSQSGERRNEQAHEVGEMIDPFLSQLFNKLLNLGIKELTKKSTTGSGSFTDKLSGNSQQNSNASAKGFVLTSITTSLAVEKQYQTITQNIISKHQELISSFRDINLCYLAVSKKSPTGITIEQALVKANTASTTINSVFAPQINRHYSELQDSNDIALQLLALGSALGQAQTTEEINAISTAYDALATSGVIHTSADITFLATDSTLNLLALQNVLDASQAELAQCKTY